MLLAIITYFILVFPVFFGYYIIINILYMLYFLNTIKSAIWTSILLSLITFYCPFSLLNLTLLLFYFLKLFFLNSFNFSSVSYSFSSVRYFVSIFQLFFFFSYSDKLHIFLFSPKEFIPNVLLARLVLHPWMI